MWQAALLFYMNGLFLVEAAFKLLDQCHREGPGRPYTRFDALDLLAALLALCVV